MGNTASRWTSADIPSQASKVAIVTGANSGIGYEAAKALAEHGATVILACRSEARGKEAVDNLKTSLKDKDADSDVKVEFMSLDLGDQTSIKSFVKEFDSKYKRLDLLINNAGIMMPTERTETTDKFEVQFGVNHLGHFSLTNLLLPKIVNTQDSRIVVVSSLANDHVKTFDLVDASWRPSESTKGTRPVLGTPSSRTCSLSRNSIVVLVLPAPARRWWPVARGMELDLKLAMPSS
jgi:NAD(P)-dependent dehydrogenase (short-subunit alcohol dehydrogenase family)